MRTALLPALLAGVLLLPRSCIASDDPSTNTPRAQGEPAARLEVSMGADGALKAGKLEHLAESEPASRFVAGEESGGPPHLPPPIAARDSLRNASLYRSMAHPDNAYTFGYTQGCPFLFRKQLLTHAAYLHGLAVTGGSKRQEGDIIRSMVMESFTEAEAVCKRLADMCKPVVAAKVAQSEAGTAVPLDDEHSQPGYNFTCTDTCLHMARLFPADLPTLGSKDRWPEGKRPDPPKGVPVMEDVPVTPLTDCAVHLAPYLYNRTVPGATAVMDADKEERIAAGQPPKEETPGPGFLAGEAAAEVKFNGGITSEDVAHQLCRMQAPAADGSRTSTLNERLGKKICSAAMRRETHRRRRDALQGVGGVDAAFGIGWSPAVRQWAYMGRKLDTWLAAMRSAGGEAHIGLFPHKVDFITRLMHAVVDGVLVLPQDAAAPAAAIPRRKTFHVCQTGLGAGHSALAFLMSHPSVYVTSFDVGILDSMRTVSGLLSEWFDKRHATVPGHTRTSLPQFAEYIVNATGMDDPPPHMTPCDLVFLDASDSRSTVAHDLKWFAAASAPGALVLLNEHSGEDAEALAFLGSLPRGYLKQSEMNTMANSGAKELHEQHFSSEADLAIGRGGRQKAWRDAVAAGILSPRAYITGRSEEDDEDDRGCVKTLRAALRPLLGVGGEAYVQAAVAKACDPWAQLPAGANTTAPRGGDGGSYAWLRDDALAEMLFAVAPQVTELGVEGGVAVDAPGEAAALSAQLRKWNTRTPRMFRSVVDPADALPHDIAVGVFTSTAARKSLSPAASYFFVPERGVVNWRMLGPDATGAGPEEGAQSKKTKKRRRRRKSKGKKRRPASKQ